MRRPTSPQRRLTRRVLAAATVALAVATMSTIAGASGGGSDPNAERQKVREQKAQVAAKLNVLKASDAQIQKALDALEANVSAQQARVASARQAATTAEHTFAAAQQAEQAKQAELDTLTSRVKQMAIDAYVNPTTGDLAAALSAKSLSDVTRKRELLQFRVSRSSDLVDRLKAAREDLAVAREQADAARQRASQRRASVEAQLGVYQHSLKQQHAIADQVEAKLDEARATADSLDRTESALTADIKRREAIAIANARASRGGGGTSRGAGNISLSTVRGITVASSIADNLAALLSAADGDGYSLSGSGYRDPNDQVAVRRANCGTSDYAIYEMPASQCSPPTARPGTSMHEQGLAIDFTWQGRIIGSRSSPAYQWMASNASRFGFYNLPSEPWHWSTNGN